MGDRPVPLLWTLIQGMPMFSIGMMLTLLSSFIATKSGKALLIHAADVPTRPLSPMDVLSFSMLGLSSLSLHALSLG